MSNYLMAFGSTESIGRIYFTLKQSQKDYSEISVEKVSESFSMLSVSKDEFLQRDLDSVFFFKGWFQDHVSQSIVLGGNGFQKWTESNPIRSSTSGEEFEGAYISACFQNETLCIRNDLFSYLPVIYFCDEELFICSDSMYIISKLRTSLGIPCKLNKKVIHSRSWTHGLACSVMSNQSQINGVELLSPGKHIEIQLKKKLFSSRRVLQTKNYIKSSYLKQIFNVKFKNYKQAIRDAATTLAQSTISILHIEEVLIKFGLSGGLDSRVILAAVLQKPELIEKITITTNTHPSRKRDFDIVKKLSDEFNFPFNDENKIKAHKKKYSLEIEKIDDRFSLWVLSSMGLFDMMYLHETYWPTPHIIEMGGHGAESIKGTFASAKFEDYIKPKKVNNKAKFSRKGLTYLRESKKVNTFHDAIRLELSDALLSSGINIDEVAAIQWHYLSYKSPIANGRYLDRSSIGIRPFIQHSLFALSISKINPFLNAERGEPNLLHDMLILLNPELAGIGFENEKDNLSKKYIKSRLEELGGRLTLLENQPYTVFGKISDMRNGPPSTFLEIVEHNFKSEESDNISILDALEHAWEGIICQSVKKAYQGTYETAKERLVDSDNYLPSAGTPAAKIISVALLNSK